MKEKKGRKSRGQIYLAGHGRNISSCQSPVGGLSDKAARQMEGFAKRFGFISRIHVCKEPREKWLGMQKARLGRRPRDSFCPPHGLTQLFRLVLAIKEIALGTVATEPPFG